jgi:hypothetical protein
MIDAQAYRYPVCTDAQEQVVRAGDVVQLDPERHVKFGGCMLTVTEAREWGVVGYVAWPEAPATARAAYRAERGTYLRVGVAAWRTPPDSEAG